MSRAPPELFAGVTLYPHPLYQEKEPTMSWNTQAIKASLGLAFKNTARATSIAATTTAANTARTLKATPAFVMAAAPKMGIDILKNIGFNMVLLETIDGAEALYGGHKRRKRIKELNLHLASLGDPAAKGFKAETYAAIVEELEMLSRTPERRSFGRFLKDLPSRTWRRVARALLLEAGWWTMILTSPIWIPVGAFALAWIAGVAVVDALRNYGVPEGTEKDFTAAYQRFNKPVNWVFNKTFFVGLNLFRKGATMRVYDKKIYTGENTFDGFDAAKVKVDTTAKKMENGETAYAYGEQLADAVNEIFTDTKLRQEAFAQGQFWVRKAYSPTYYNAVMQGFKDKTPFIYRDLVRPVTV